MSNNPTANQKLKGTKCLHRWVTRNNTLGIIQNPVVIDQVPPIKTDRSKRSHWRFGRNVLTDKKSGHIFLRSIFNPTHHVVCLCLDILAVRMAFVRKCCGGKFGWLVLVDSSPKLILGTSRYVKYSRVLSQLTCCARRSTSRYSTLGKPYCHNATPPPTMTMTRDVW
jgi:hypothetical protein